MTDTPSNSNSSYVTQLPGKQKRTLQERLTAVEHAAHTLNEKSNTLSATLTAVEKQLTAAGIGLEVWTWPLLRDTTDDHRVTGREFGYAKIGSAWHLAVRDTAYDVDEYNDHAGNEWNGEPVPLAQCSRQERITALERLPKLLDELEAMAQKAIKTIDDTSALVDLD